MTRKLWHKNRICGIKRKGKSLGCLMGPKAKNGARKSSRRLKAERQVTAQHVNSKLPKKLFLETVGIDRSKLIHDAVKKVLWEVGAIYEHVPTQQRLINDYGCREIDGERIQIPPDLVDKVLSTLPRQIKLFDLDGHERVDTSSKTPSFCPGHNCVQILDYKTDNLRPALLEDIRSTARLCDALPNIDVVCSLGYPSEVAPENEVTECTRVMYENSTKPAALLAHDEFIQERMMKIVADIAGGWNRIAEKPVSIELMGPVSPLKLPAELCVRLTNCARWRVPVVCYPATFPGMSSPISIAGAIVQSSAEAIAGILIHQLEEPGAPVMSGSAILPMDLRQANLAYGSPEYMLSGLGASEYLNFAGIPTWVGGGCSDSHQFDAQAAAEAGANLAIAGLANASFVHNLGFLSEGRTGSLELLTLCDEMIGWTSKMANGLEINPETLAVEVIQRAAPNNEFLTDPHTQDRFLTENWYPKLSDRSDSEAWQKAGAQDMRARIKQKIDDILH